MTLALVPAQGGTVHPMARAIHHTLTGHDIDLICHAAGLDPWTGGRDDHPLEASDAPLAALRRHGRRLGTAHALAVTGLDGFELHELLVAVQAVMPALYRDVFSGRLFFWETVDGVRVLYLLGIEVVR